MELGVHEEEREMHRQIPFAAGIRVGLRRRETTPHPSSGAHTTAVHPAETVPLLN